MHTLIRYVQVNSHCRASKNGESESQSARACQHDDAQRRVV